jgi:hypothetical protein
MKQEARWKHKNIWNSFCNFLDERFAEVDLSEILDTEEIARVKIPPTIPALLEFIPMNVGDVESEEERRARNRAQALADKSYVSKEASHLDGLKKLKQKFNRAIVLVLKHVDAQINLDLHQLLKSDPIKNLELEAKYKSLREHFSEHWGPASLFPRRHEDKAGANGNARRRPWMEEVFAKLQ